MCIDHEAIEKDLLGYHGQGEQFSKALVVRILLEQPGFVEHVGHLRAWDVPGGHPFNSIEVIHVLRDMFIKILNKILFGLYLSPHNYLAV